MTKLEMVNKMANEYNMGGTIQAYYLQLPYEQLRDAYEGYMALLGHAEKVL